MDSKICDVDKSIYKRTTELFWNNTTFLIERGDGMEIRSVQ